MAEAGDLLVHMRQRLDALSYNDHSQYLLTLLQASSYVQSVSTSRVSFPPRYQPNAVHITGTSLPRQTLLSTWLRYVGLTAFYVRLVLLLGMGWLLAMVGIFTFLYALPAAQEDIVLTSTAQVILLLGLYFLGGAVGSLAFGMCADYFGRKPVLLSALSFWLIVNGLTAGAWNYASFVTLRLLSGMGIGGQLALLATLALEYTPTKTRGKITILTMSMAGLGVFGSVGYGQLAIASMGAGELGWRMTYGVLSIVALLFAVVLYLALEESPKYLASVGRTEKAFCILGKIETAHGINRQARVTVPTSLYEPPSRRPRVSYERYLDSSSDSEIDLEMAGHRNGQDEELHGRIRTQSYDYTGPGAAKARSQSQRASTRRLQSRFHVEVCTSSSEDPETPSDTLTPSASVTFLGALARRVVALFSGALAVRTVVIWFYWFAQLMSLSAAIVTTLMMAASFNSENQIGTTFGVGDQLFWSAMTFPGLLLAAMMVETVGRRGTLALFVFCGGAVMVLSAWLLEEDGEWIRLSLALGAMVLTTGGTLGVLVPFTGEQFPLLTRALGLSCASAWGHLGMFTGVYLVLRRVMDDEAWSWHDERVMLAVCGGVSIVLLPVILLMGPETRGRDIDASWFESSEALQALAGGVLSVTPSGRSEQPAPRYRRLDKDKSDRGSKGVDKRAEPSGDNGRKLPDSPFGRGSVHGMSMAAPVIYSPASPASATARSLAGRTSSSSSSSPSSNFWQTHKVRHLGCKMKRTAQAIARSSDEKQAVHFSSDSKKRAPSINGSKKTRGRNLNINDRCDTLPVDDLDQLDSMVIEHEYRQPRRQSVEPVLIEWRHSCSSSRSGSALDFSSSSKVSRQEQSDFTEKAASVCSTETGRYTIDLDMFDTFTYISTPVLGGDNCSDHEHREPSNLSSASSS